MPTADKNALKPTIYWILQKNHVTPFIVDFLNFYRSAAPNVNIRFLIPSLWEDTIEEAKGVNPEVFQVRILQENSYEWYCRKKDAILDIEFSEGLYAWQALLHDDLHEGQVNLLTPELPEDPTLQMVLMQIPIPLGSFENEERIFQACYQWARTRKVPVIGYELLPLNTKWNLVPSLVDGVITSHEKSYDWLTSDKVGLKNKVWLLPRYEGHFFTAAATFFWRNGLGAFYNFQHKLNIPNDKTILYIPHNVAMSTEYKILIRELSKQGDRIHLMVSIGKDQVRGTHTHQETVEVISGQDLAKFHSYSFCDLNSSSDLVCADALVACSSSHLSVVSAMNGITTVIYDPDVTPGTSGHLTTVNSFHDLDTEISKIIDYHCKTTKLGDIFSQILNVTMRMNKDRKATNEFVF